MADVVLWETWSDKSQDLNDKKEVSLHVSL